MSESAIFAITEKVCHNFIPCFMAFFLINDISKKNGSINIWNSPSINQLVEGFTAEDRVPKKDPISKDVETTSRQYYRKIATIISLKKDNISLEKGNDLKICQLLP